MKDIGAVRECLDVALNKMPGTTMFLRCFLTSRPFHVCVRVSVCVYTCQHGGGEDNRGWRGAESSGLHLKKKEQVRDNE